MTASHQYAADAWSSREKELAWHLAAEVTRYLKPQAKTALYVKLGCGENYDAIVQLLTLVKRRDLQLSQATVTRVGRWLAGYVGAAIEPAIRDLLPEHLTTACD